MICCPYFINFGKPNLTVEFQILSKEKKYTVKKEFWDNYIKVKTDIPHLIYYLYNFIMKKIELIDKIENSTKFSKEILNEWEYKTELNYYFDNDKLKVLTLLNQVLWDAVFDEPRRWLRFPVSKREEKVWMELNYCVLHRSDEEEETLNKGLVFEIDPKASFKENYKNYVNYIYTYCYEEYKKLATEYLNKKEIKMKDRHCFNLSKVKLIIYYYWFKKLLDTRSISKKIYPSFSGKVVFVCLINGIPVYGKNGVRSLDFLLLRAYNYLQNPTKYLTEDNNDLIKVVWNSSTIEKISSGFEQIFQGKGLSEEEPLEYLNADGIKSLLAITEYKIKKYEEIIYNKYIIQKYEILMNQDGFSLILYNKCLRNNGYLKF
jgi:hypothetical protein